MKIIVNDQSPLIIEDEKGNILFQLLPRENNQLNKYNCEYLLQGTINDSMIEEVCKKLKEIKRPFGVKLF